MPKQMYSANDRVKIRAEDGGEKEVTITSVQVGIGDGMDGEAVVVVQDDDMEEYRVLGSTFARALVERVGAAARPARSVVESISNPQGSFWRGQMVQVFERDTNKKVDMGNITQICREALCVNGEKYGFDKYSFLAIG